MLSLDGSIPTKKRLKAWIGKDISPRIAETSAFGPEYRANGKFTIVGPSPYHRKWYAEITVRDNKLMKVE